MTPSCRACRFLSPQADGGGLPGGAVGVANPDLQGACDLVEWTSCAAGQGCYFNPADQSTGCDTHGCKGLLEACDPMGHECSVATIDGVPHSLVTIVS